MCVELLGFNCTLLQFIISVISIAGTHDLWILGALAKTQPICYTNKIPMSQNMFGMLPSIDSDVSEGVCIWLLTVRRDLHVAHNCVVEALLGLGNWACSPDYVSRAVKRHFKNFKNEKGQLTIS